MTKKSQKEPNSFLIMLAFPCGESKRIFIAAEFAEKQKKFKISILAVKRIKHIARPSLNRASAIEPVIKKSVDEDKLGLICTYWCKPFFLKSLHIKRSVSRQKAINSFHGIVFIIDVVASNWQPFRDCTSAHFDRLFAHHGRLRLLST